jgi:hypothetical protein
MQHQRESDKKEEFRLPLEPIIFSSSLKILFILSTLAEIFESACCLKAINKMLINACVGSAVKLKFLNNKREKRRLIHSLIHKHFVAVSVDSHKFSLQNAILFPPINRFSRITSQFFLIGNLFLFLFSRMRFFSRNKLKFNKRRLFSFNLVFLKV